MRYRLLIIIVLCFLSMIRPLAAQADSSAVWQGDIKGVKTWITVVSRGHDIDPAIKNTRTWWEWGNTTTDAYIFAFDDPRNVRIILAFEQQADGSPEAKLYLNRRGRLPIDFAL